jgi:glycosyltransferase involved in cell wall biosynthesis
VKQNQPFFSIIIPTYARPKRLAACLQSLAHLDYPCDRFEVIVVDDGSKAPPVTQVAAFQDHLDITLLKQPHAGPAAARNTGAMRSKGRFLSFTDDDCEPTPDWLKTLALRFLTNPDCAVGGRTLNALHDNPFSVASQMLVDYLYGYYNTDPRKAAFLTSNNLALPADRFRKIGGFDIGFPRAAGEDREFCDRWRHYGYRMIYAPEVVVRHAHYLRYQTFCEQHFNYGRGAFYFHRVRAKRRKKRIKVEPFRFYLNLLRYPFSHFEPRQSCLLAMLLLLSQTVNAAGFCWRAHPNHREDRWKPGGKIYTDT